MDSPQNLSIDYLNLLPDELLVKILLKTDDLDTLTRWCQTSKRIDNICQDENLWHRKYRKDFGSGLRGSRGLSDLSGNAALIRGFTWKEQYKFRFLMGKNSPISTSGYDSGIGRYGLIDKSGNFYMRKAVSPSMITSSSRPFFVKFPLELQGRNLNFDQPKIISISIGEPLVGAVTENGKAYVWNYGTTGKNEVMVDSTSEVIVNSLSVIDLPTKARRIVVSSFGYIILLENSFVYLNMFKKNVVKVEGIIKTKIIDMSIGFDIYAVITENNKLLAGGNIFNKELNTNNELISLDFPKPIKRVVVTAEYILTLSTTGDVYTWKHENIFSPQATIFHNTKPKLVILPEPIGQISADGVKFASLSITGKLYMWRGKIRSRGLVRGIDFGLSLNLKPVNIPFGLPINFVSVAGNFTITMDSKGIVNYWNS